MSPLRESHAKFRDIITYNIKITVSIDDRRGRGPSQSSGPFPRDRELDGEPTRLKTKYKTKLPTNPTQSSHK